MIPFAAFEEAFLKELSLPSFGQSVADRKEKEPDSLSPAAKEISARNLNTVLGNRQFLRSVYALIKEHDSRVKEHARIQGLPAEICRQITKYRNTYRSLAVTKWRISSLYDNLEPVKSNVPDEVAEAIENLTACQEKLRYKQELLVSRLKPIHRKPHYATSQWKSLIKPAQREWNPGRAKMIDQWLFRRLNSQLAKICDADKLVSDITRYRIISVIFQTARLGIIEASAIKEYFRSHSER